MVSRRIPVWSLNRFILTLVLTLVVIPHLLPDLCAPVRVKRARYCHYKLFHFRIFRQIVNQPSNRPFVPVLACLRLFHCELHLSLCHVRTRRFHFSIGSAIPESPATRLLAQIPENAGKQ